MSSTKIRVENLPGVTVSRYSGEKKPTAEVRPFRVLFIKPYQKVRVPIYGPPLGILTLIACIRAHFGTRATIHFWDMALYHDQPEQLRTRLDQIRPDIIGVSALNCEAAASLALARIAKAWSPEVITAIGGPVTLHQAPELLAESAFDWVFQGAADRTLLQALARQFSGVPLGSDIPGFSYRDQDGRPVVNAGQDLITDLDSIPVPAWDLVDLDRYRRFDRNRGIANFGERKYAYLFTSRGCPYLCSYCHDIFTKRFVYQSNERVIEEIRLLHEEYGVEEIHVLDDIFNLHRPRVRAIMREVARRWPGRISFAFTNGLRGDILDPETIAAMVAGGTYFAAIAMETVTPRLQQLVEKNLDIEKAKWAVAEFARYGIIVRGNFMVGFPSETAEEIEATIRYAITSPLTTAAFSCVVPQAKTAIYDLAFRESASATTALVNDERDDGDYSSLEPWYSRAYGYNLHSRVTLAFLRFYLHPPRIRRILRIYSPFTILRTSLFVFRRLALAALSPLRRHPGDRPPDCHGHGAEPGD